MNKKIDLNGLSFISYVASDLDAHLDDLISVNTIIADVGSFIEYQGLQYELGYSYSNQKKKLNTLSDDIETFAKAATTGSNNNHANSDSVADILYACVEHPFYLSLDDTIERLSKVEIDEYEVKNTNGIVSKKESWNQTGYRDYERVLNSVTYDNLNINDILKSQYSRDRMRGNYERYLQALYPNIKDFSVIDADMFYESYLAGMLTLADFDHTTLLENSLNILRTTGAVLAFGTLFFTALPGAATFLGVNVGGLSIASGIVNGGLSIVDALCLFNGTDINGNPLTPSERDALMATVTVDAVFLSISVAGKIRYNASKGSKTLTNEQVNSYLEMGKNNSSSDKVILGTTGNYDVIGEMNGYSYFQTSDETWRELVKTTGENYDEVWKVNKAYLDDEIAAGKEIFLSNNPKDTYYLNNGQPQFYQRELDYLEELNFTFEDVGNGLWKAIKK